MLTKKVVSKASLKILEVNIHLYWSTYATFELLFRMLTHWTHNFTHFPSMNSLALVPVTTVNSSTLVTLTSSLATTATAISSVLGMVTINHAPTISVAAIRS